MRTLSLAIAASLVVAGCGAAPTAHFAAENALGPYSGSVVSADFVFASGKVGRDREDFASEAGSSIDRVESELARHGLGLADIVSVTVYLTDMGRYTEFNEIYKARLPSPYPARTCVAVAALPGGAQVEITAIARR